MDLVGDAGVGLDPVQVASHTSEARGQTRLAARARDEGSDTNQAASAVQNQWAAGITLAGGWLVGGRNADDLGGGNGRAIGGLASSNRDNLEDLVLECVGHTGSAIGGLAPAGGGSLLASVGGVAAGNWGQQNLVDVWGERNDWGPDQRDIVSQSVRVVASVLLEVGAGDGVGQLGVGANQSAEVDGHGGSTAGRQDRISFEK